MDRLAQGTGRPAPSQAEVAVPMLEDIAVVVGSSGMLTQAVGGSQSEIRSPGWKGAFDLA